MRGFKAFNEDLTCREFQYEIGQTYEMKEEPKLCERGFHFCKTIAECYNYYSMSDDTRICEVEALGVIDSKEGIAFAIPSIFLLNAKDCATA